MSPKIMLAGPQGSGKTTQAKLLAEKLGILFIGAGEVLRKLAQEETEEGRNIKAELDKGELVDNQLMADLIKKEMEGSEASKGFITDGYPRSLDQIGNFSPDFTKVFYLELSDEEAEKRLLLRNRGDDTPEAIRERLSIYHQLTEPVLEFYQNQGKLVRIDGSGTIEEVAQAIQSRL